MVISVISLYWSRILQHSCGPTSLVTSKIPIGYCLCCCIHYFSSPLWSSAIVFTLKVSCVHSPPLQYQSALRMGWLTHLLCVILLYSLQCTEIVFIETLAVLSHSVVVPKTSWKIHLWEGLQTIQCDSIVPCNGSFFQPLIYPSQHLWKERTKVEIKLLILLWKNDRNFWQQRFATWMLWFCIACASGSFMNSG